MNAPITFDDYGPVVALGEIVQWPNGYAMSLGPALNRRGVVRCCAGHETPEEAKSHGLVRLIEMAAKVADRDVAVWATRVEEAS